MNILFARLALVAAAASAQQRAPISADEVTLRHKIYGNERLTVFLLDIPPGQATLAHRHGRDMLSVFVSGGRTRASFNRAPAVEDTFAVGDVGFAPQGLHSTENIGTARFTSVIFEFASSQGKRVPSTQPTTHTCNPGSTTVTPKKMSRRVRYGARCDEMATSAMKPSIVPIASCLLEFACGQFRRDGPHGVGNHSRREPSGLSLGGQFAETLNQ